MPGYYGVLAQNSHLGYTSTAQMGQFHTLQTFIPKPNVESANLLYCGPLAR